MKHLLREKNYPFYTIALLALHATKTFKKIGQSALDIHLHAN